MAFDYKKEYKEFYLPPRTPGIVTVPAMNFLAVWGHGDPNEENGAYKQALGMLYAVAFAIKMSKLGKHMPQMLAQLTGAEVVHHTRGGARLSEHLNPKTKLGAKTQEVLDKEHWDYVVLQEMSHGPITAPGSFFASVEQLCNKIWENGAVPILYATWAYQRGGAKLTAKGWDYSEMAHKMSEAYHKAARENHALLADVGRKFYELSDTQNLYAADGVHPSELGSRIAAETIAAVIQEQKEKLR